MYVRDKLKKRKRLMLNPWLISEWYFQVHVNGNLVESRLIDPM